MLVGAMIKQIFRDVLRDTTPDTFTAAVPQSTPDTHERTAPKKPHLAARVQHALTEIVSAEEKRKSQARELQVLLQQHASEDTLAATLERTHDAGVFFTHVHGKTPLTAALEALRQSGDVRDWVNASTVLGSTRRAAENGAMAVHGDVAAAQRVVNEALQVAAHLQPAAAGYFASALAHLYVANTGDRKVRAMVQGLGDSRDPIGAALDQMRSLCVKACGNEATFTKVAALPEIRSLQEQGAVDLVLMHLADEADVNVPAHEFLRDNRVADVLGDKLRRAKASLTTAGHDKAARGMSASAGDVHLQTELTQLLPVVETMERRGSLADLRRVLDPFLQQQ